MKIPSLIHNLFNKNNLKFDSKDIEETSNGVWIKHQSLEFVSGNKRKTRHQRFVSLLGEITKNAVSLDKQKVNFFLWSDIGGNWYFKSADSLIKQGRKDVLELIIDSEGSELANRVLSLTPISEVNPVVPLEAKHYFSSYERVDPDFTNKYIDFLDTNYGLTYATVKYDYFKHFDKTEHVVAGAKQILDPSKINIAEKLNVTEIINREDFGYFDSSPYNTPNEVWWDYLGKKNDRYNDISWKPQYDITSFSFPLFYKIQTQIRIPLIKKRLKFNKLKNIKRKWEAYRCTVCCMDEPIGSSADVQLFKSLATQNPLIIDGVSYDLKQLFGKNGLFINKPTNKDHIDLGSSSGSYRIVAAGSITDGINYDTERTDWQNGLTFAVDLNKSPYNETIGQFYHLTQDFQSSSYYREIIEKGIKKYNDKISENQARLEIIKTFGEKIDEWIKLSIEFIGGYLVPCSHCIEYRDKNNLIMDVNNYWAMYRHMSNDKISEYRGDEIGYPSVPCGYKPEFGGPDIPVWSGIMSKGPAGTEPVLESEDLNSGLTGPVLHVEGIGKVPYFRIPQYNCLRSINFNHEWGSSQPNEIHKKYQEIYDGLIPDLPMNYGPEHDEVDDMIVSPTTWINQIYNDKFIRGKDAGITFQGMSWGMKEKCIGRVCYNEYAFNPNVLYALKQIAIRQQNILRVENYLLDKIKTELQTGLVSKLSQKYQEWINRPAFFHSKTPGTSIFKGPVDQGFRGTTLNQPISLQGIKKITRKPIRGSRYEILAKAKGITGASMGQWLYNIWFEGENAQTYSGNTANPYYKQGYRQNWLYFDRKEFRSTQRQLKIRYYTNKHNSELNTEFIIKNKTYETLFYGITGDGVIVETDPKINDLQPYTLFDFNQTKKPPNLKREEIASYVRVEFNTPIGLNRIQDFPNGFVRDMGSEYFAPYIVSLTPGPSGRQSIRNNIALIGMDPYGFDIAVKKSKIESRYDHRNNWLTEGGNPEITQTELSRNGMDLWPEPMFETRYPYYGEDPRQMWSYSNSYTGMELPEEKWQGKELAKQRSADTDPERRKTHMGSGLLMGSHRKIKPHRSWWSIHLPKNIFIPQKLYSQLTTDLSDVWRHGHHNYTNLPGDPYDGWLNFLGNDNQMITEINGILANNTIG
jgi:hypothetical protein